MPYVWYASPPSTLRTMQLWYLPVVTVILALFTVGWSDQERPWRDQWQPVLRRALPLGLFLALVYAFFEDRHLRGHLPLHYPTDPWMVLLALPWVGLFQTLFTVTATYAIVFRLCRRQTAALAAIVFAHQGLLILQQGDRLPPGILLVAVIFTGLHGLILGLTYCAVGFAGPVAVAVLCHLRHLIFIFAPG